MGRQVVVVVVVMSVRRGFMMIRRWRRCRCRRRWRRHRVRPGLLHRPGRTRLMLIVGALLLAGLQGTWPGARGRRCRGPRRRWRWWSWTWGWRRWWRSPRYVIRFTWSVHFSCFFEPFTKLETHKMSFQTLASYTFSSLILNRSMHQLNTRTHVIFLNITSASELF